MIHISAVILFTTTHGEWELSLSNNVERMYEDKPLNLRNFLHEREAHLPVNNKRWDLLGPIEKCKDMEVYGSRSSSIRDNEAKRACGLKSRQSCTIFSLGSNGQWEFENAIVASTNCTVWSFDCTVPLSVEVPPLIAHRVDLIHLCLGLPPPEERNFFLEIPPRRGRPGPWRNRRWVRSGLSRADFKNYTELVETVGLKGGPSLLKMDIEGYEWQTMRDIVSSRAAPQQIAVEMHFQTQMPGLGWFGRYKTPVEILAFGNMMHRYGYHIASREDNSACKWCTEVLWIRGKGSS
jgi:hypothetical protein